MWRLRWLLILFIYWLGGASPIQATHIVGGEMNYRCLGNNQYEIILTVYRDCFYGVPFFDDPASVGVFNANNSLVTELKIPFVADDTLQPILQGECFVVPPSACVHTTTYKAVVSLPPLPGGYTLAYQRCCRNNTILNIVEPDATGATFSIYISEFALAECNTSPLFKEWPPIYICVDEPILFDHSALDLEGDSIVYRLCTPLDGATPNNPRPQPPFNPPYPEITWLEPAYDLSNVMGGVPLTIDPLSGLLTGIPNTIGQFVVGICADEYRDGVLMSTTRRDFQYNVGVCGMTASAFLVPEFNCNLTVSFTNTSTNANQFIWYFDMDNDLGATSTEYEPTFTYPDSGTYRIMLIAQPGDPCVDTLIKTIRVERPSITAFFDPPLFPFCDDSLSMSLLDKSTDTIHTIVSWQWRVTLGQQIRVYTSDEQHPTFRLDTTGFWRVELIVTSSNGCQDTFSRIVQTRLPILPWQDTTFRICRGDSIRLNPHVIGSYNYTWSPNQYLSHPNASDPLAYPDSTITYTMIATTMNGLCKTERTVHVEVSEPFMLEPPPDTILCNTPVLLSGTADRPAEWVWASDPAFMDTIATGNPALLDLPSAQWVYIHIQDGSGCDATDSFYVDFKGVILDLRDTLLLCPDEPFELGFELHGAPDSILSVEWLPAALFPNGNHTNPVIVEAASPGVYSISLTVTNASGCETVDTLTLTILDLDADAEAISVNTCGSFKVLFELDTPGAYAYQWDFGDATLPGVSATGASVSHTFPGPGQYEITVFVISDGGCQDTIFYLLELGDPPIQVAFDWNYLTCADTANVLFYDQSLLTGTGVENRNWFVDGVLAGTDSLLMWTVHASTPVEILLIIYSSNGCVDSLQKTIVIPVVDISIPPHVAICLGDTIQLNPDGNVSYQYFWMPSDGLDDPQAVSPFVSPASSLTYFVTVSLQDPDTCSVDASVFVEVFELPEYTPLDDVTICEETVMLTLETGSANEVVWATNSNFTPLIQAGPGLLRDVSGVQTFYYRVRDNNGCLVVDSVRVTGSGIGLDMPDLFVRCVGDTLRVEVVVSGDTTGLIAFWSGAGQWIPSESPTAVFILPNSDPFELSVVVENLFGCQAEGATLVDVLLGPLPLIAFADPEILIEGNASQLSTDGHASWTFSWSPSESLSDPHSPDPIAMPEVTTTYTVVATDFWGCTGSADVTVRIASAICEDPYIFVPNTFTPNSDNLNDRLFVRGHYIDVLYFIVYDRWGNEVFRTYDKDIGWDGTYKGTALNTDVFGYYLEARCFGGEIYRTKGNVTLLRN